MSNQHLHRKPHAIRGTQTAWWYEDAKGIYVVVEAVPAIQCITIPWAYLRGALKRKDRP